MTDHELHSIAVGMLIGAGIALLLIFTLGFK